MTAVDDRTYARELIEEAVATGARLASACRELGISARTWQRWRRSPEGDGRPTAVRRRPSHALTEAERTEILTICHLPKNASLSPMQIVPALADTGVYIASESSFYRVLHAANEQHHRGRTLAPRKVGPPRMHTATGPNQVWTWDVSVPQKRRKR